MVSGLNSFSGLSGADIATLFGKVAPDAQTTDRAGIGHAKGAAGAITGTQLIGAGSNAATAIQTIVTQIQVEKMQANVQGKIATLDSASVSTTFGITGQTPDHRSINISTTVLDLTAKATAEDLTGAVGTLLAQVKAQETEVEAAQDGILMSRDDIVYGGHSTSGSSVWTSNSVTINMKGVANLGVQLSQEEGGLEGILDFTQQAQAFQAPLTTGTSVNGTTTPPSSGTGKSALYLQLVRYHGDFSALYDQERQLVSDFVKGALPGQDGKTPENGAGFGCGWTNDDESSYGMSGVMISDYDPTVLTKRPTFNPNQSWLNADQKTAAMDGTVIGSDYHADQETLYVIIPLDKRS